MVPVPLILHLSDLHLAAGTDDEVFGDHKREVVRRADRQGRTNLIRSSLRALGAQLRRADRSLDALVISGDITDRGNPAGFALLTPTLRELGPVLPEPGQIMVVPGNHDVAWFTEPSSRDRYQGFLDGVRAQGYVTPLLEGIDIDLDGHRLPGAVDPLMQVADGTVVILGLNTANYCGVAEEADSETAEAVAELDLRLGGDPAYQRFRENWYRRGAFDLARLGSEQRRYGIEALEAGAANALVRVATMHHQLLPVGFDEEVKPFESLLNLAVTRSFLAEQRVDVLLHGHKHCRRVPGQPSATSYLSSQTAGGVLRADRGKRTKLSRGDSQAHRHQRDPSDCASRGLQRRARLRRRCYLARIRPCPGANLHPRRG